MQKQVSLVSKYVSRVKQTTPTDVPCFCTLLLTNALPVPKRISASCFGCRLSYDKLFVAKSYPRTPWKEAWKPRSCLLDKDVFGRGDSLVCWCVLVQWEMLLLMEGMLFSGLSVKSDFCGVRGFWHSLSVCLLVCGYVSVCVCMC